MRRIIVLEFMSLDGVMQAPGGPGEDISGGFKYGGWTVPYFDDFSGKLMEEQMSKPFELLLGRKTYEIFASYWPHHSADWPGINEVRKYVVSHDEIKPEWKNSVLLKDEVVSKIQKLKEQDGPDLHVYGWQRQFRSDAVEARLGRRILAQEQLKDIDDWRQYLSGNDQDIETLRLNTRTGRPIGGDGFVLMAERIANRVLRPGRAGRPRNN